MWLWWKSVDFDLWRQMTVEHLIDKSQSGYLKQIRELVRKHFARIPDPEKISLTKEIDSLNIVTACQFCNPTTSRDISEVSMIQLFDSADGDKEVLIKNVQTTCENILDIKRKSVAWKLESVRKAFDKHFLKHVEIVSK